MFNDYVDVIFVDNSITGCITCTTIIAMTSIKLCSSRSLPYPNKAFENIKSKYIYTKSIEKLWAEMKNTINGLRNDFVPTKKIDGKPKWKEKGSIPISKSLRNAIRDKKILHRRWSSAKRRGDANSTQKPTTKLNV